MPAAQSHDSLSVKDGMACASCTSVGDTGNHKNAAQALPSPENCSAGDTSYLLRRHDSDAFKTLEGKLATRA